MKASAKGRFCSQCKKEVFDLTNCSLDEVRALQQEHGSICGSIRVMSVAAVAASLSVAACENSLPPKNHEGLKSGDYAISYNDVSGGIRPIPKEEDRQIEKLVFPDGPAEESTGK